MSTASNNSIARMWPMTSLLGGVCFICVALSGCQDKVEWQEEVELNTGETGWIQREVKYAGGGAAWPRGQGGIPRQQIIRFKDPSANEQLIEWRSYKTDSSTYAELPLVLGKDVDNTWFIFTLLPLSSACDQYLKYQFKGGAWSEVRLPDDIGIHLTNLTLKAGSRSKARLISLTDKVGEKREIGYRSRLKKVGPKRFACSNQYSGPYPPVGAV